jgi:hypothetical protein
VTSAVEVVIAGLAGLHGADRVATATPPDLEARLPFYRVQRVAGLDVNPDYDSAFIDIDTFAADELTAYNAAESVRAWVRKTLPGTTVAGVYINATFTVLAPRWVPWDNTNLRRVTASYRFILH